MNHSTRFRKCYHRRLARATGKILLSRAAKGVESQTRSGRNVVHCTPLVQPTNQPTNHLSFSICHASTEEKDNFITQQCSRLSDGIEKINEASLQIDQLSIVVEEQRKNVVEAAKRCEQMLVGIETCRLNSLVSLLPASPHDLACVPPPPSLMHI